jgi:hypothetical protein
MAEAPLAGEPQAVHKSPSIREDASLRKVQLAR